VAAAYYQVQEKTWHQCRSSFVSYFVVHLPVSFRLLPLRSPAAGRMGRNSGRPPRFFVFCATAQIQAREMQFSAIHLAPQRLNFVAIPC
jgi:hypothetical protein